MEDYSIFSIYSGGVHFCLIISFLKCVFYLKKSTKLKIFKVFLNDFNIQILKKNLKKYYFYIFL